MGCSRFSPCSPHLPASGAAARPPPAATYTERARCRPAPAHNVPIQRSGLLRGEAGAAWTCRIPARGGSPGPPRGGAASPGCGGSAAPRPARGSSALRCGEAAPLPHLPPPRSILHLLVLLLAGSGAEAEWALRRRAGGVGGDYPAAINMLIPVCRPRPAVSGSPCAQRQSAGNAARPGCGPASLRRRWCSCSRLPRTAPSLPHPRFAIAFTHCCVRLPTQAPGVLKAQNFPLSAWELPYKRWRTFPNFSRNWDDTLHQHWPHSTRLWMEEAWQCCFALKNEYRSPRQSVVNATSSPL